MSVPIDDPVNKIPIHDIWMQNVCDDLTHFSLLDRDCYQGTCGWTTNSGAIVIHHGDDSFLYRARHGELNEDRFEFPPKIKPQ